MTCDFNMIESPLDRSKSTCSCLMGLKEGLLWVYIKSKYYYDDYFSRGDGPIYSWDNLRDDGVWVLARLDRFYPFSS